MALSTGRSSTPGVFVGSPARGITPRTGESLSTSVDQFARKMDAAGRILASPQPAVVLRAAAIIGDRIEVTGRRRGITTFAGQRWGGYRVKQRRNGEVVIFPRNVGATVILNEGAPPHVIGARALASRARWKRDPLGVEDDWKAGFLRSRQSRRGGQVGKRGLKADGYAHPIPWVLHPGARAVAPGFVGDGLDEGVGLAIDATGSLYMSELFTKAFSVI